MDEVHDPAVDSLLRSKMTPPGVPVDHVNRPGLEQALAQHVTARLLLLCAPAGFGKTTALVNLAAARSAQGQSVAWLSLAADDDEPGRFFNQLIDSVAGVISGFGEQASGYLYNVLQVPVASVLESLLLDLAAFDRPLLLILDDFHLIQNRDILNALTRLVQLAPKSFTLAIGSRTLPSMALATLRAKDLLLEIGQDDLRLSEAEARDYLQRSGVQVADETFVQLYQRTEGWVIGLHLASLWLRNRPEAASELRGLSGDKSVVGNYLLSSVFEQLPEDLRESLLALAVPSQLCGDLANALTGRPDGQALLEQLEQQQLFLVPLDRERQWYRFHHLFADFLRSRLRERDLESFKQLNFNACLWFANHRMQNLAIEHAALAEDSEMLAALVDGCGLELINRGQLNAIYRWRLQLPDEIVVRYPILNLSDVWNKAATLTLAEANHMLDELLARWGDVRPDAPISDSHLAALAVKAVIALQKDDLEQCVNLARRVEPRLGQQSAFLEVALLVIGALAHTMLARPEQARRLLALAQQRNHFLEGRYLDMQLANVEVILALEHGNIKQARDLCGQLHSRVVPSFAGATSALVLPTISEALIDYQQGVYSGIEERLLWALKHVDVINPIDMYAQAMLCLARIQRMQDRGKEAVSTLVAMQNLAARNQSWRLYALAVVDEITLILQETATDRLKRAEQRLKSIDWDKLSAQYRQQSFNPVIWLQGLLRVRLQQARGHFSEALHEITQLRARLCPNWHGLQRMRLDLLAALSYQRLGYQERAYSLLVQCLVGAEREGVRSLFIEEGEAIRQLLQQLEAAERQPALQGFIRSLLAIWPGLTASKGQESLEEGLTEREREVVRLAARGHSNEEIGEQLRLALGTVKWHLHNIYEKLKVRNRTQAIRRARELGLLEP